MMRSKQKTGFYEKYIKRLLDIICSLIFILLFWWLYIIIAILVRVKLGKPILFKQPRPGKDEEIFDLYKFRTMTDAHDSVGNLLSDEVRLTRFGKILRSLSLDEIPEVWLILTGKMSMLGPRPLLVRDMVFMSDLQRLRHSVKPGLSGLAQVMGRNDIDWEEKLNLDIEYINNITFWGDVNLLFLTIWKVFKRDGITENNKATAEDYGDYLLRKNKILLQDYTNKQAEAKKLIQKGNLND